MKHSFYHILFVLLLIPIFGQAQKGVTTFGLQYKPIIPNRIIGTFEQEFNQDQFESTVKQRIGHSYGMVVRVGLTKNISFETGINYTKRNFGLNFSVPDSNLAEEGRLGVVSYEIPVSGLVYIRLGENFYINTSLGVALTMFPSDVRVAIPLLNNIGESFRQEGAYRNKIEGAVLGNLGFEYRTRESGYFYFGTSYHLPFSPIMTFAMSYEYPG